ncbi:MAG: DUF1501 domain-containing protein [Pirellulaceae bacterium]
MSHLPSIRRRDFLAALSGGSAVLSLSGAVPHFWQVAAAAESGTPRDTVLVVIQLTGGNDGLNTIVPFRHDAYRRARPKLAIPADQVLKIDGELGFHPAARGLADLLEAGQLAVVQGVGYPEPNRSHFESMDIWHTCQRKTGSARTTGWLGRYLDATQHLAPSDSPGLHVGPEKQPLALAAANVSTPSLASPDRFRLQGDGNERLQAAIRDLAGTTASPGDELLGFVRSTTTSALSASERIAAVLRDAASPVAYPDNELARKLKLVAQLIAAGLKTRVYYVELDGFDTHSQQPAAHAALLQQFSGAMKAFLEDIAQHGEARRVLAMAFSEFGRRVAENASEGTDHGAAAPMFLAGAPARGGLLTPHPSLDDLTDGDLRFQTDFRQVYASVLTGWLGWPSADILGGVFEPVRVLAGG